MLSFQDEINELIELDKHRTKGSDPSDWGTVANESGWISLVVYDGSYPPIGIIKRPTRHDQFFIQKAPRMLEIILQLIKSGCGIDNLLNANVRE